MADDDEDRSRRGETEAGAEDSQDDSAASADAGDAEEEAPARGDAASSRRESRVAPEAPGPQRASRWWWLLPAALVVEFWYYGYNGHIEVCVGKPGDGPGEHDFDLVGAERTDENRWKIPRCETELNLGLKSGYDSKVDGAVKVACRGATLLQHKGEMPQCVAAEQGWIQQIRTRQCPPWHAHFWEHLFWFLD